MDTKHPNPKQESNAETQQDQSVPDRCDRHFDFADLQQKVIAAIRTVFDPEIHVNIYDLGLIYRVSISEEAIVDIDMTLTAPACPVAEILPQQVVTAVKSVEGVKDAKITLVWEPPWNQERISEAARLELGMYW
ncbi:MAG: DUF59 domain-containing protein [Gammaproteobacteria bacterium]|nr:DUF59 domain-containing protein [Gammaproteobacteria bacterium]